MSNCCAWAGPLTPILPQTLLSSCTTIWPEQCPSRELAGQHWPESTSIGVVASLGPSGGGPSSSAIRRRDISHVNSSTCRSTLLLCGTSGTPCRRRRLLSILLKQYIYYKISIKLANNSYNLDSTIRRPNHSANSRYKLSLGDQQQREIESERGVQT